MAAAVAVNVLVDGGIAYLLTALKKWLGLGLLTVYVVISRYIAFVLLVDGGSAYLRNALKNWLGLGFLTVYVVTSRFIAFGLLAMYVVSHI